MFGSFFFFFFVCLLEEQRQGFHWFLFLSTTMHSGKAKNYVTAHFYYDTAAEVHSVWDHLAGPQTTLKDHSQYSFTSLVKGHLAKLSSVTLVLNVKKWTIHAQIFNDLPKKHILPLVSILTTVIRWIPQHLLVLLTGNKKFSLFTCFFFHCLLDEVALQYTMANDPVMSDKLIPQHLLGQYRFQSFYLFLLPLSASWGCFAVYNGQWPSHVW